LQGNLWRFDIDDNHAPKKKAFLMATFTDTNGKPQTISTRPVPVRVKSEGAPSTSRLFPAVIVGTGRYLGITDAADRMRHTVYAIRDDLVDGEVLRVRDESSPLQARRATTRKGGAGDPPGLLDKEIPVIEGDPVDWNTSRGWYLDLALDSDNQGERVNLDMLVYGEALLFVANSPAPNICDAAGGRSWLFALDVDTGKPFYTNAAWTRLDGLAVGLSAQTVFLGGEKKASELGDRISATSINQQGETATTGFALPPGSVINSINRSSWRELIE
jgi:type IV pilus assembly protein PilY1